MHTHTHTQMFPGNSFSCYVNESKWKQSFFWPAACTWLFNYMLIRVYFLTVRAWRCEISFRREIKRYVKSVLALHLKWSRAQLFWVLIITLAFNLSEKKQFVDAAYGWMIDCLCASSGLFFHPKFFSCYNKSSLPRQALACDRFKFSLIYLHNSVKILNVTGSPSHQS